MSDITGVPMLDPRRANDLVQEELHQAFDRCLGHGRFILGDEVTSFEEACADYLGVKHAIGVSSGTDALIVSLMALDIGPGDEVICPTFTFFATAGSIWRVGAKPIFADSKPRCFNLDPSDVAAKITKRTKAVIPVHLFGQCAEMESIGTIAASAGMPVIEDAAQAFGADTRGRKAGSLERLGCFSFFPAKNLGGFGDGGLVTTDDGALADKVRALRAHGGQEMYDHPMVGGNFRLDALQAALLNVKLAHVDAYAEGRHENAATYTRLFVEAGVGAPGGGDACSRECSKTDSADAPLILPTACQGRHVYNQYVLRAPGRRDALQAHLKEKGVGCAVYYPRSMHLQGCFRDLGGKEGDFPVAEKLSSEVLAIPVFSELTEAEVQYVADTIIAFMKTN
ncbi:MAG: DegT/DnrJ/EryC1/StrS family aminotransferase [Myxococcota bacterium]